MARSPSRRRMQRAQSLFWPSLPRGWCCKGCGLLRAPDATARTAPRRPPARPQFLSLSYSVRRPCKWHRRGGSLYRVDASPGCSAQRVSASPWRTSKVPVLSGVTGAEPASSGCPPHHRVLGECQRQDPLLCRPFQTCLLPLKQILSPLPPALTSTDICVFTYLQNVSFLTFDAQSKRITFWWHLLHLLLKQFCFATEPDLTHFAQYASCLLGSSTEVPQSRC